MNRKWLSSHRTTSGSWNGPPEVMSFDVIVLRSSLAHHAADRRPARVPDWIAVRVPSCDSTSPPPIPRVHFWSGFASPRRMWPFSAFVRRWTTRLVVRRGSSWNASSCAVFVRLACCSHVIRSKRRTPASRWLRRAPCIALDELRWVGLDECDLPVLSVFKDLHPRVAGFVFLTTSSLGSADVRRCQSHASVRLRIRHAPPRCFRSRNATP